jgi:hypothetical protein
MRFDYKLSQRPQIELNKGVSHLKTTAIHSLSLMRPQGRIQMALVALVLAGAVLVLPTRALAADHRESPTADATPEGDITDLFAFLDPNSATQLVLIMDVNPFSVPDEPNYSFSPSILYQFKIANNQYAVEDLVVQVMFSNFPAATCASGQMVSVYGPTPPTTTGLVNTVVGVNPTVTGCTNATLTQGNMTVFTGQRSDPFIFDIGQYMRIIQSNQDLFRDFPSFALGALHGRPVRADMTSGVDGFGGFNVSTIAIELPKSDAAGFLGNQGVVGIWATTSMPLAASSATAMTAIRSHQDQQAPTTSYMQFQRVGQQIFKTVFVPSTMREAFNASVPENDVMNWSSLVPDALTTKDNDGTGNTIAARASLLTTLGFTDASGANPGQGHGAPLLFPGTFANTNVNFLRNLLLPDVLRLDLNNLPTGLTVLPGAAASGGNSDPQLGLGVNGLQNGRRPTDVVSDIVLQFVRQFCDLNFPASTGVPGSGPARPGALNFGTDRRTLAVLDGTFFYRPDAHVGDVSGNQAAYGGNPQPFLTTFPFLPAPNPLPGETGTVGFPVQQ